MCVCSHLPAYLVAAFVKRLARLALTAPPPGLLLVLPFIYNLIRRHPSCRVLLHQPGGGECSWQQLCYVSVFVPTRVFRCVCVCVCVSSALVDPYVMEEADPALCGALESSLWEVKVGSRVSISMVPC